MFQFFKKIIKLIQKELLVGNAVGPVFVHTYKVKLAKQKLI